MHKSRIINYLQSSYCETIDIQPSMKEIFPYGFIGAFLLLHLLTTMGTMFKKGTY